MADDVLELAGYDLAGYDLAGEDELGRARRRPRRPMTPAQQRAAAFIQQAQAQARLPGVDAARKVERREQDLGGLTQPGGASFFTFGPATAQSINFLFDPWKSLRPVSLVVDVVIVGVPASQVLLSIASIGPTNMLGSSAGIGIGRFSPLSPTKGRIQWAIIDPRIGMTLTFVTTAAPAAATSITITPTIGCVSVG